MENTRYKLPADCYVMLCICVVMVLIAFIVDSPAEIFSGFFYINTSRSVLVSDYVALGGLGAALVNAAVSGLFYLILLVVNKVQVTGKIIFALFLTIGFSLFGKNLFNMLPILLGVWVYGKIYKTKFSNLFVQAMVSGTVGPIVSEIAFLYGYIDWIRILTAYGFGLLIGFIFPIIMEAAKRMHRGYCLYNGGIAGGFIATFFVGIMESLGIEIIPENFWDTEHTVFLAFFAYILSGILIVYGLAAERPVNPFNEYWRLLKERNVHDNDYYKKYGSSCYINIGILCIVATSLMLVLNVPINGPVLGGILTIAGFGAAGKHIINTVPILIGSLIAAYLNYYDMNSPANVLAILFSTGLAPIAGKYGWIWGIVTGFIHVSIAIIIGNLNGGMNLYNNGFAGGFVAITLVPIIAFLKHFRASPNKPKINEGANNEKE